MARKTILVVDDEKPQRDILQEILTSAGYDVTSAASGEAAMKFAKERSFDLALTEPGADRDPRAGSLCGVVDATGSKIRA